MMPRFRFRLLTKGCSSSTLLKNSLHTPMGCSCFNIIQNFSSKAIPSSGKRDNILETEAKKKKKTPIIPKVTLLQKDELTVTTLEEAQKLSKRRNLKLVKIIDLDTKSQRPIYKLMTDSEYLTEELKQKEKIKTEKKKFLKGEKLLLLGCNISDHDLQTSIRKIMKWIGGSYEVHVVINGDANMSKAENVFSTIEQGLNENGRILQKRNKGSDIKFQIIPPKKNQEKSGDESSGKSD